MMKATAFRVKRWKLILSRVSFLCECECKWLHNSCGIFDHNTMVQSNVISSL